MAKEDEGSHRGRQPDSDPPCADGRASSLALILPFGPFPTRGLHAPPPDRCAALLVQNDHDVLTVWWYRNADLERDAVIHTWKGRIKVQTRYSITPFHGKIQDEFPGMISGIFDFYGHDGMFEQVFVVYKKSADFYAGYDQKKRPVTMTRFDQMMLNDDGIWCEYV